MAYTIEFKGEKIIEIKEGQSILEASLQAGIPHYHECGGKAKCSTCRILIMNGTEALSAPNEKELRLRETLGFCDNIRLACQTKVTANAAIVRRIIRDKTDVSIYSNLYKKNNSFQEVGEERELALFFLDIRNFTPFMESHLPFDVIHIVRRLFQIFKNDIETHNGKIIETAGDGLYAVFGTDRKLKDAINSGVTAGYQILNDLKIFNENYAVNYFNHQFEVGIGLHAGHVIVGNIGLGISNNLTVMGLPVNIASRLQSATKEVNNSFIIS
ncbi:MAG TPA: adenylate/guanylate cyclase domain-containing protein, partial [Hanamia sp.]|nr:adenylate/guanylate cyclase domain-containing protein [Hanamia sp.]